MSKSASQYVHQYGYTGFDTSDNNSWQTLMRHSTTKPDTLPDLQLQQHQQQFRGGHPQLHSVVTNPVWPSKTKDPPPMTMPIATEPIGGSSTSERIAPQKRAQRRVTEEIKRQICDFSKENSNLPQAEIAKKFGLDRSTISKILSHKNKFMTADEKRILASEPCVAHSCTSAQASMLRSQLAVSRVDDGDHGDHGDDGSKSLPSFANKNESSFMDTMPNSVHHMSSPANSDAEYVLKRIRPGPSRRLDLPEYAQTSYQVNRLGLTSGLCQMPLQDADTLPPTSFFFSSPQLRQSRDYNPIVVQSRDLVPMSSTRSTQDMASQQRRMRKEPRQLY